MRGDSEADSDCIEVMDPNELVEIIVMMMMIVNI